MKKITDEQILSEIQKLPARKQQAVHSLDMVRIALEWLDAQKKLNRPNKRSIGDKHDIEHWAGRYISATAVQVAANLHPEIKGTYPYFNISSRLVRPNPRRLVNITEAGIHPSYFTVSYFDAKYYDEP